MFIPSRRPEVLFVALVFSLVVPSAAVPAVAPVSGSGGVSQALAADTTAAKNDEPGEIYFVFGSDTSTGGLDLRTESILFRGIHLNLYISPMGNAARIMSDQLRQDLSDWYGDPMQMTWWMQGGSIYQPGANSNVPLPSTLPLHLMKRYHGEAIERHGDELTFHYHTWKWTDYTGDGVYYWNQTRHFSESRDDFDLTTAQYLIEEDVYAVSFRSGWHYLDNEWQARLDELLPFSMHNDAPNRREHHVEPFHNVYDWSRAPLDFVPFRPLSTDYQLPGGTGGWNVRSRYTKSTSEHLIRQIFAAARDGQSQVVCIWSHLVESDFVEQFIDLVGRIRHVAADYEEVPYRFTTAIDAMQRWLETDDREPPELIVEETGQGENTILRIETNEDIFQPAPFVALKDVYERYHVLPVAAAGHRQWEVAMPFERSRLAKASIAVTDSVGNLSTHHVNFLPDDIFVDNLEPAYEELEGDWQTVPNTETEQVWGADFRLAVLAPGERASVRWTPEILEDGRYHLFVRSPEIDDPVSGVRAFVYLNDSLVDSTHFEQPLTPSYWQYVGTVEATSADEVSIEVTATNRAGDDRSFAADAVRLSALIRDRQLALERSSFVMGDIMYFDREPRTVHLRNLGIEPLIVSGISVPGGSLTVRDELPLTIPPLSGRDLSLEVSATGPGEVIDTLAITSNDPAHPVKHVPFSVRFMDYFVIVDNDDPEGYVERGNWLTSVTQAYGPSSRFAPMSAPSATATFSAAVDRGGMYDLSIIVPQAVNSAHGALYLISVDGVRRDSLIINQNDGSGAWRSLGLYRLEAGSTVEAEIGWGDLELGGLVIRADAMRLAFVGDELEEIIADNDDPERYEEFGTWSTSNDQAYGPSSRWAQPAENPRAVFKMRTDRSGLHSIQMIVPHTENASRRARYRIIRNGAAVDSVFVNQNERSGTWRLLGSYLFSAGDKIEVEVTHAHAGVAGQVLRADAVKMIFNSRLATSVHHSEVASSFELGPNYPNPVNSEVTFRFDLPHEEHATVKLYDLLGRIVEVIVDERAAAGRHTVRFDASHLSSGVYLCRLEAGGNAQTRKWVILR